MVAIVFPGPLKSHRQLWRRPVRRGGRGKGGWRGRGGGKRGVGRFLKGLNVYGLDDKRQKTALIRKHASTQ